MPATSARPTRAMAREAWGDMRSFPLMWFLLSASALPQVFLFYFLVPAAPASLFLLLLLAGYAVCFALHFLFWSIAVLRYEGRVSGGEALTLGAAYRRMLRGARSTLLTGLTWGAISVMAYMAAQMVVSFILSMLVAGGASEGSLIALTFIHFYLSYLVADLVMVLLAMAPQFICLGEVRKVEEALRLSYRFARAGYGDALTLFIIPEIIARTLFLGASFLFYYLPRPGLVFAVLLVSMSLLEGGRTAFIAAAFNRFYHRAMEEERRRKKEKGKGKKQASRQTRKK
ncbi:MAG: hypothetical protein H5T73_07800 [Actinobacteria bacterium]|nr:hypothetical protein [Actinomycetota bacterium]